MNTLLVEHNLINRQNLVTEFVRISFGLDSKTGLDSGPTSPNNEFVKRGRKN